MTRTDLLLKIKKKKKSSKIKQLGPKQIYFKTTQCLFEYLTSWHPNNQKEKEHPVTNGRTFNATVLPTIQKLAPLCKVIKNKCKARLAE